MLNSLNDAVHPDSELGFGISETEARGIMASYKQAEFGFQEADGAMQKIFKLFGLDGKGDYQYDTLQKRHTGG